MKHSVIISLVSLVSLNGLLALSGLGCDEKKEQAPAAASSVAAPKESAAEAKSALPKMKITKNECTFEFSAPEALNEVDNDTVSIKYQSASFSFTGYSGAELQSAAAFPDYMKRFGSGDPVESGQGDGIQWAIVLPQSPLKPFSAVMGIGGEIAGHRKATSPTGCTFSCTGTKERRADVVAMCKSVKISVDESKIPQ